MRRRDWIRGWGLIAPALALIFLFTHFPTVTTILTSLFSTPRGKRPAQFVGSANYERLIHDATFWKVLGNNLIYAAGTIPTSIALALVMALLVNRPFHGRTLARMACFTPTVLPLIAVANIWLFFYMPGFGLIDQILGVFGLGPTNLLGAPDTALPAIMAVAIWKEAGFFMIFYLAALQTIPPQLAEAARIEGAGAWAIFRRITLPLLMPTTLFISINAVINAFRLVDHIFILTGGGPDNASSLLLYYIYATSFRFWDTSYGATLTVVLLGLLGVLAIGPFFVFDRKVHYK